MYPLSPKGKLTLIFITTFILTVLVFLLAFSPFPKRNPFGNIARNTVVVKPLESVLISSFVLGEISAKFNLDFIASPLVEFAKDFAVWLDRKFGTRHTYFQSYAEAKDSKVFLITEGKIFGWFGRELYSEKRVREIPQPVPAKPPIRN